MVHEQTTSVIENWKPVVGYEMAYEISDRGRLRALARELSYRGRWGQMTRNAPAHDVKPVYDSCGYVKYSLCVRGKARQVHAHRLVLEAFVGPCPLGMQCCHGDGNPANNLISNLRWGSPRQNAYDRLLHGRTASAKLTIEQVKAIRLESSRGTSRKTLLQEYKLTQSHLTQILKRRKWASI